MLKSFPAIEPSNRNAGAGANPFDTPSRVWNIQSWLTGAPVDVSMNLTLLSPSACML